MWTCLQQAHCVLLQDQSMSHPKSWPRDIWCGPQTQSKSSLRDKSMYWSVQLPEPRGPRTEMPGMGMHSSRKAAAFAGRSKVIEESWMGKIMRLNFWSQPSTIWSISSLPHSL